MSHGSCCQEHTGESYSLFRHIDIDNVLCYNEKVKDSIKKVFKPYDNRTDQTEFVESDADEQLIIHIPFTGLVKLKSICIVGGSNGTSPSRVKLFVNREDVLFDNVDDIEPVQEIELLEDVNGELDYPLKVVKFNNLTSMTLYVPENFGNDKTVIYYIGLKGEFTKAKREPVKTNYEVAPNPAKNKNMGTEMNYSSIM